MSIIPEDAVSAVRYPPSLVGFAKKNGCDLHPEVSQARQQIDLMPVPIEERGPHSTRQTARHNRRKAVLVCGGSLHAWFRMSIVARHDSQITKNRLATAVLEGKPSKRTKRQRPRRSSRNKSHYSLFSKSQIAENCRVARDPSRAASRLTIVGGRSAAPSADPYPQVRLVTVGESAQCARTSIADYSGGRPSNCSISTFSTFPLPVGFAEDTKACF